MVNVTSKPYVLKEPEAIHDGCVSHAIKFVFVAELYYLKQMLLTL